MVKKNGLISKNKTALKNATNILSSAARTRISHKPTKKGVENCQNIVSKIVPAVLASDPYIYTVYPRAVPFWTS
jgi:hypothetical protein